MCVFWKRVWFRTEQYRMGRHMNIREWSWRGTISFDSGMTGKLSTCVGMGIGKIVRIKGRWKKLDLSFLSVNSQLLLLFAYI